LSDKLILRISKNEEYESKSSSTYDIYLNDWKLGKGVRAINLDMQAPERPHLTIECHPDLIEIDDVDVEVEFRNALKE
jgi:hypothetical protein